MGKRENIVRKKIELAISADASNLILSNPSGVGVVGQVMNKNFAQTGDPAIVRGARWMAFGLGVKPNQPKKKGQEQTSGGFADKVGFHKVKITEEMIGMELPVFLNLEIKDEKGKVSELQQKRIDFVLSNGGLAGVARNVEEAEEIVYRYERNER